MGRCANSICARRSGYGQCDIRSSLGEAAMSELTDRDTLAAFMREHYPQVTIGEVFDRQAKEILSLQYQIDALRTDAERYRWLRTNIGEVTGIREKSHALWIKEGSMSGKDAFDKTV